MTKEMPPELRGKRINTISDHLKDRFGKKTIKLAIDGGFTCPNRDGSKGFGGCTFCSDTGSGEFSSDIDDQIRLLSDKWPDAAYLAYFQNHTNTYAPVDELRKKYFGQEDHVRLYGEDFIFRVRKAGFKCDMINPCQNMSDSALKKFGVNMGCDFFLCIKPT